MKNLALCSLSLLLLSFAAQFTYISDGHAAEENSCELLPIENSYGWRVWVNSVDATMYRMSRHAVRTILLGIYKIRGGRLNNYELNINKYSKENYMDLFHASLLLQAEGFLLHSNCEGTCNKFEIEEELDTFITLSEKQIEIFDAVIRHYKQVIRRYKSTTQLPKKDHIYRREIKSFTEFKLGVQQLIDLADNLPAVIYACPIEQTE